MAKYKIAVHSCAVADSKLSMSSRFVGHVMRDGRTVTLRERHLITSEISTREVLAVQFGGRYYVVREVDGDHTIYVEHDKFPKGFKFPNTELAADEK